MDQPRTKSISQIQQENTKKHRSPKMNSKSPRNIQSPKTLVKGNRLLDLKNKVKTELKSPVNKQLDEGLVSLSKKEPKQVFTPKAVVSSPRRNSKIKNKVTLPHNPNIKSPYRKQSQALNRSTTQNKKQMQTKQITSKQTAKKLSKTEQYIFIQSKNAITFNNVQNRSYKAISCSSETNIKRKLPTQPKQNDQSFQEKYQKNKKLFKPNNQKVLQGEDKTDTRKTRIKSQTGQNSVFNRNKESFLTDEQSICKQLVQKDKAEIVYEYEQRIEQLEGYILDLQKEIIKKEKQSNKNSFQAQNDINDSLQEFYSENYIVSNPPDSLDQMRYTLKRFETRVQYLKEERQVLYDFAEKMIDKIKGYKNQIRAIKKMKEQAHLHSKSNIKLMSNIFQFNSSKQIAQLQSNQSQNTNVNSLMVECKSQTKIQKLKLKQKLHMSMMITPLESQVYTGTTIGGTPTTMKKSEVQFFTAQTQKKDLYKSTTSMSQVSVFTMGSSYKNDKVLTIKEFCQKYRGINKAKIIIIEKLIQFYLKNQSDQNPNYIYFDPQVLIVKGSSRFLRVMHIDDCQKIDQRYVIKPLRYLSQLKDKTQVLEAAIWNLILIINFVKTEEPFTQECFANKQAASNMKILKNVFKNYETRAKVGNLKAVSQVILQNIF